MTGAGTANEPIVTVVIVTYGTGPVIADCLEALTTHTTVAHEIVVVDNPRPDAAVPTAELLAERGWLEHPSVVLVRPERNLGFAGGNNVGAGRARGSFLAFVNPDVIVGPGWLEPLLAALEDPAVAIAAPVLIDPDGSLQEAGQLLYDDGCTAAIGGPEVFTGDWGQAFTRDVDYASAACWVVRSEEFAALGGFDERYHPAFFEDVDYALRVEQQGQRTRLVADVPVVHRHGEGGAGKDLAMGQASQAVFRSIWSDRLTEQLPRPDGNEAASANRDRLAGDVTGWIVSGATVTERREVLEQAIAAARSRPRDRVCVALDDATGIDLGAARRAGVDVVVGDVERAAAVRARSGVSWARVGAPPYRGLRDALASLWSPWTLLVAALGIVLRVLVLRSPAGYLNSDEAYTGLASMGVLDGRFPVVLDGNRYTAVLEAYLFAPVTAAIGPSVLALKTVPIVMWALAAVVTFLAADYLAAQMRSPNGGDTIAASRRVAAVAGTFVWLTPGALLVVSTLAYPAYALGMAVCVGTLLWAARVIDRDEPDVVNSAILGGLSGLGFYLHPMFLAAIVPLIVPVAWVHRRQGRRFWVPAVAGGLVTSGPFLLWNVVNGFPSLEVQNALPGTYTDRLQTFFRELIPRGYGLRDGSFEWILGPAVGVVAYVVLIAAAVAGCVLLVRRGRCRSRWLLPIVLVAVWPLMALFSPLIWSADGRYNIITFAFVALAAALPLAAVPVRSDTPVPGTGVSLRALTLIGCAAVAIWAAVYVGPHTDRVVDGGAVDANASTEALIDRLQEEGIDRIAGSYWRVLVVEYLSDREIIGAVSWPDPVRFPDRQRIVESTPPERVAFVFPPWAERPEMLWMPVEDYTREVVDDTVVYWPSDES